MLKNGWIKNICLLQTFLGGFNVHFHVAPVTEDLLRAISRYPNYSDNPDGNDAIIFLSREYCERPLTAEESEKQHRAVRLLSDSL